MQMVSFLGYKIPGYKIPGYKIPGYKIPFSFPRQF